MHEHRQMQLLPGVRIITLAFAGGENVDAHRNNMSRKARKSWGSQHPNKKEDAVSRADRVRTEKSHCLVDD